MHADSRIALPGSAPPAAGAALLAAGGATAPLSDVIHLQFPPHLADLVPEPRLPDQPDRARLVVEAELLLSRQSFSAAMARSTPKPRTTYEPVLRSR